MANQINNFCFIHIEKAGGSTIHNWLKYYIPNYQSLQPWYVWTNEPGNYLTKKELKILKYFHPGLKAFGSHTTRHYLGYENLFNNKLNYITFVREPVSRYLSHYQHQRYVMKNNWSLDSFINEPRFNNFMTKRLTNNVENGTLAFKEIEEHFSFVGIIERFDESILLLSKLLKEYNVKPFYERKNEGERSKKIIFSKLPNSTQQKIINNNQEDIVLYKRVVEDLYPNQLNSIGLNFSEMKQLKEKLIDFKYNKIRYNIIRYYKGYNHYITEPIAHHFR